MKTQNLLRRKSQITDIYYSLLTVNIKNSCSTSLAVQWLRLCSSTAGGKGSIHSWESEILHALRPKKKKETNWLFGLKKQQSSCKSQAYCTSNPHLWFSSLEFEWSAGRGQGKVIPSGQKGKSIFKRLRLSDRVQEIFSPCVWGGASRICFI